MALAGGPCNASQPTVEAFVDPKADLFALFRVCTGGSGHLEVVAHE